MSAATKGNAARITATAAAILVAVFVCLWYYRHDPSAEPAPSCLFRTLTGFDCPGCGSQRALHALLHGRIAKAWSYNAFLFFAVPAAILYTVAQTWRHRMPRLYNKLNSPLVISAFTLAIILWWVLRNIC
ncbi:MAG: DUF2752 domain-containing protein [Muribaculaceae bacterium]|nr:DUF2752 domain-containing protein [Muribaculaceae bacterium]